MCQAKNLQPLREDLCDVSLAFFTNLKTNFKFLRFCQRVLIIYKKWVLHMVKFIVANQNQPDKTTDIVIDTNKTICPEFDLPKLTCDCSHVLSIDETDTYLCFNVSPELSK